MIFGRFVGAFLPLFLPGTGRLLIETRLSRVLGGDEAPRGVAWTKDR